MSGLFNRFTDNGYIYVNTLTTGSKANKLHLIDTIENKTIELKGFSKSTIDLSTFNWIAENKDRNWWWQLQALPILSNYIEAYSLLTNEAKDQYFNFCLEVIINWKNNTSKYTSPLAWHDHATAFRLRNVINWLFFCYQNGYSDQLVEFENFFQDLIRMHIDWLLDNNNYSKFTNHGFDQSMIIYVISLMIKGLDNEKIISRQRLESEIQFAFTEDGVHKENSPGYQKFMLSRLKGLSVLQYFNEDDLYSDISSLIVKAEEFLKAVTMPNGYLPMVGDTQSKNLGILGGEKKIFDYSGSGYFIIKDKSNDDLDIYLLLKNSHLSNYHRHDDDCSIFLMINGEIVLSDGGLYSHEEKDEDRIFVRSIYAHNVPVVEGAKVVRDVRLLSCSPSMVYDASSKIVTMTSYMYGKKVIRSVDFSQLNKSKLIVTDFMEDIDSYINQNFYFTHGTQCKNHQNNLSVIQRDYSDFLVEFEFSKAPISIVSNDVIVSYKYNQKSLAQRIYVENDSNHVRFTMQFKKTNDFFIIKYRGQQEVTISRNNNWLYDDLIHNNYTHHILSLRWLLDIDDLKIVEQIVIDFYQYHESLTTIKSRYYSGRVADHTTAIRLQTLSALKARYIQLGLCIPSVIEKEFTKNLMFIVDGISYKPSNNHGLSCDLSVLSCASKDYNHISSEIIIFILERVFLQLQGMFFPTGECKEHSISYQEYNLQLLKTAYDLINLLNIEFNGKFEKESNNIESIFINTKKITKILCGFALKSDETYFTIGDTFLLPNSQILESIFHSSIAHIALMPYSKMNGLMLSAKSGFASFRNDIYHFYFTASWHSYVHKQNDDLSCSLVYKGRQLFLDGGYSDIVSKAKFNSSSEMHHSLPMISGESWHGKVKDDGGISQIINAIYSENIYGVVAKSNRIKNCMIYRAVFSEGKALHILDYCTPIHHKVEVVFLIPMDYIIEINVPDNIVIITCSNDEVITMRNKHKGTWNVIDSEYLLDKSTIGTCYRLTFFSETNASSVSINNDCIDFYDILLSKDDTISITKESKSLTLLDVNETKVYDV